MESITTLENLGSTKNLIIQSFITSGGSLSAHALYIQGIALHLNLTYLEVSNVFKNTIKNFSKTDVRDLLKNMSSSHKQNPDARERTIAVLSKFKESETIDILIAQIPTEENLHLAYLYNNDTYKTTTIDRALVKIWQNTNETERNSNLKALSASLGLYPHLQWWEKLPNRERDGLIAKGQSILDKVDS